MQNYKLLNTNGVKEMSYLSTFEMFSHIVSEK